MIKDLQTDANGRLLPFTTDKYKYTPIVPGTPMGILRWKEYEKLRIIAGFGKSFSQLVEMLDNLMRIAGGDKPMAEIRTDLILTLNSAKKAIVDMSSQRYPSAFYLATLFIVREGHTLQDWSYQIADDYIEDWEKSSVNEQQLFFFALSTIAGFKQVLEKIQAEADQEAKNLSDIM